MATTIDKRVAKYAAALNVLAPYLEPEFPSMGNRTPGSIVDDIGSINELLKDCEKVKKTLQGIADSKMSDEDKKKGHISGEKYKMTLVNVSQRKLDQGKAKAKLEELGVDEDEYMYDLDMQQHRYKAL